MPAWLWIVLGVLLILVAANHLDVQQARRPPQPVDNGWAQIDVQLRRRYDLIPNLVESVKGYAAHERDCSSTSRRPRAARSIASSVPDQAQAENQITARPPAALRRGRELPRPEGQSELPRAPGGAHGHGVEDRVRAQFYNDR